MDQYLKRKDRAEVDIDNLPADPGFRPSICSYDANDRDTIRRAYLVKGPHQPKNHNFPQTIMGNYARRFNAKWFEEYPTWLEYSVQKDAVFCLYCYLFKPQEQIGSSQSGGNSFVTKGFKNWKKKEKLLTHVGNHSSTHNKARQQCESLMKYPQQSTATLWMSKKEKKGKDSRKKMEPQWTLEDFLSCSGSTKLAREMAAATPFADLDHAIQYAKEIWFNKVDVKGWLESFAAHPEIGATSKPISEWSKEEQSTAMVTAKGSTMQELLEWNALYKEKFGFVFLICASGRSSPEILDELKRRFVNRPIVELETAAEEEMKIIELRLRKLFDSKLRKNTSQTAQVSASKHEGIIGGHLMAVAKVLSEKPNVTAGQTHRTRPPITTHVLDVARGSPASGLEVRLEIWKGAQNPPSFAERDSRSWVLHGSSITSSDGRTSPLMAIADDIEPGFYRISFNTGNYNPSGFFPYVNIVFQIRESEKSEHFHVPLLLSPFSFSTYRGS